jgi:hypothetical protein
MNLGVATESGSALKTTVYAMVDRSAPAQYKPETNDLSHVSEFPTRATYTCSTVLVVQPGQ